MKAVIPAASPPRDPGPPSPANQVRLQGIMGNIWLVAALFGLLMFVCSLGIDWLLLHSHQGPIVTVVVSDGLAGFVAGLLVLRLLRADRERRRMIEQRLQTISDMNHHIRNALQVISFSVHSSGSQKELAEITESVERIRWALREILPRVEPSFEPFEGSARVRLSNSRAERK